MANYLAVHSHVFVVLLFLLFLSQQQMPGFIGIITSQDIPPAGTNNFVSTHDMFSPELVRQLARSLGSGI